MSVETVETESRGFSIGAEGSVGYQVLEFLKINATAEWRSEKVTTTANSFHHSQTLNRSFSVGLLHFKKY